MRLSDEQLRRLVASDPSDTEAVRELRDRTRWKAIRALPNPTGTCAAGHRVYLDQRGAYSSGYLIHARTHSVCEHGIEREGWDADTLRTTALRALIEELRNPPASVTNGTDTAAQSCRLTVISTTESEAPPA